MSDDRHHEPARRLRGDADVNRAELSYDASLIVEVRVEPRLLAYSYHDSPHQERKQRELDMRSFLRRVQFVAQFLDIGEVHLLDNRDVRNMGICERHALRNFASKPHDLHFLDPRVTLGVRRGVNRASVRDEGVEIIMRDTTGWSGPCDLAKVDSGVARLLSHRGRRQGFAATGS